MPHIVYKHGDEYRLYTPTLVVRTGPRKSISANLMYIPFTGVDFEVLYVVHDGPYYFSGSRIVSSSKDIPRVVGDGHIQTSADTFIVPGVADKEDLTILLMPQTDLYDYMVKNAVTTPHVIFSPCGTVIIVAPDFYASSTKEYDILSCPDDLQPLYLGFEAFEDAAVRVMKEGGCLRVDHDKKK